ncbi:MAG: hypothetical protein WBP81_12955, partial [Solirubrobacteraceae bacterium]
MTYRRCSTFTAKSSRLTPARSECTAISIPGRLRGASSSPVRDILALTERPGVVSFAGGLPAPELFDLAGLRDAFAAVLADDSAGRALQYSTTEGDPALGSAIAWRLTTSGLDTEAEDLLITSGSQQALTLVAGGRSTMAGHEDLDGHIDRLRAAYG